MLLQRDEEQVASPTSHGSEVEREVDATDPGEEVDMEDAAEEEEEDEDLDGKKDNEDYEEEEHVDTSAAAARGRRKSSAAPGKTTEAGIIKTIYCENFMCHRKLRVNLYRNVNFIHGQNGSGKFCFPLVLIIVRVFWIWSLQY